jgi:cytochrome P450
MAVADRPAGGRFGVAYAPSPDPVLVPVPLPAYPDGRRRIPVPETSHELADAVALRLFQTREGRTDPYPLYHRLRELAPVHRSSLGLWLLTRYADISALLRDPRFAKNFGRQMETTIGPDWREHPAVANRERSMLNLDGPAHTRLRSRVLDAFKRRSIDALRPTIERAVEALLAPYAEAGGGDLLQAVAFPLPVTVIGEMLGVPAQDRPPFRALVADVVAILEVKPTAEALAKADAAETTIRSYFLDLIAEKRRKPDDGVLSQLVHGGDDDPLDEGEIAGMASLLFGAGFETTTNLIGNGVLGLLRHPEETAKLRGDPALFTELPDELLRYDGTAQAAARYTLAEVEVGGVKIPAGESVLALLGAGNHDPAEFARPDAIDVARPRFRPLSFGGGIHFCLGAALARAELEITFRALFDRFDRIELAGAEPRFRDRLILRGLESLDLACRVAARGGLARVAAPRRAEQAAAAPVVAPADPAAVRPPSRSGLDDGPWRNALRTKVESEAAATAPEVWVPSGPELTATIVRLARAGLFRRCTPQEIAELAATAYPMSFEPGDRLTTQGAESLDCYLIAEGEAEVAIDGRTVRSVGEHDVVGERGPLEGTARTATVTATSHMATWAISRARLLDLAARSPTAAEGMFAYMREHYPDR